MIVLTPDGPTFRILAAPLVAWMFDYFYNHLSRDPRLRRVSVPLTCATADGVQPDLLIPDPLDYWGHQGKTLARTSNGSPVHIMVPSNAAIFQVFSRNRHQGLGLDTSRNELVQFITELIRMSGLPALQFPALWEPEFNQGVWDRFAEGMPGCFQAFKNAGPQIQARGAEIIHWYAASRLLILSAKREGFTISRQSADLRPDREADLLLQEQEVGCIEQEVLFFLELYWYHHYEGLVLPGADDDPILRFFPPVLAQRRGPRQRPDPVEVEFIEDEPNAPPQAPPPPLGPPPEEPEPVAGLIEVLPGDPVLAHPRIAFYLSVGGKRVYRTTFFKRDDYFAIPMLAQSGLIIVALVSLHEEKRTAADYFFVAGRPTDPRETLLRWTVPAQWTRKRVRKERPEIYLGKVRHHKEAPGTKRREQPAPAPAAEAETWWHNAVRSLLATH